MELKKCSNHRNKRVFFAFGIALFLAMRVLQPTQALPQDKDALAKQVDEWMRKAFPASNPGSALIVQKAGKVILRQGYGMADLELGVPMAPDMVFRLGSITKQFTAVAILMLADQGKLSLQDEITRFMPDYPVQGKKVTIEHLLTHTSGIQSYTDLPEWLPLWRKDMTVTEIIDLFKNKPFQFKPGERWAYCNSGYILLGAIVEKVSGQSYEEFIQKSIFTPLGMNHSHYGSAERVLSRRIPGYSRGHDSFVNAPYLSMTQPYAAGSLLSNVDDMALWNTALTTGKLLKKETLQKAWTSYRIKDGSATGYGYGWSVSSYEGRTFIEHGGGINGFTTYEITVPAENVYVALLNNCDSPAQTPESLAFRIAALTIGKPYQDPKPLKIKAEMLERLTGVYRISERAESFITREGDRLFSQRSGGARYEVFPVSATEFFFNDSPTTRLVFLSDAKGRMAGLELCTRLGMSEKATRTDKPLPAEKKAIKLAVAVLDRYLGEYELAPGFLLMITREGERLFSQPTGQEKLELFSESETRFFLKEVDAKIEFQVDAQGIVTSLILHQGGQSITARKK